MSRSENIKYEFPLFVILQSIYTAFRVSCSLDVSEDLEHDIGPKDEAMKEELHENYARVLNALFSLEETKIQSLIKAFNENGANITPATIAKLTGCSIDDGGFVKGFFVFCAHNKMRHPSDFRPDISYLKEDVLEKVVGIFDNALNPKGIEGLNKAYLAISSVLDRESFLAESAFKIQFEDVRDEKDTLIGLMPLVRVRLVSGGDEGVKEHIFTVTVDGLRSLIETFEILRKNVLEIVTKDRKSLGDLVVFAGDDNA